MSGQFEMLFSPFRIKSLQLGNRLIMAPMHTVYGTEAGTATDQLIDHYVRRAQGGVGLIVQEATSVTQEGRGAGNWLCIAEDHSVSGWRRLTDAVHEAGGKIAVQIHHAGAQTSVKNTGLQPVAPSLCDLYPETPRVLTVPEIVAIEDAFADAAARALASGYDAIELHGAHGYLFTQFMSPLSNYRVDEYGGDLAGRLRFARNTIAKIRRVVGPEYPVFFRLSADEYIPGGLTLSDSQVIAPLLVRAGVDALHVSAARGALTYITVASMDFPRGNLLHLAAGIKKAVDVPVIAVGRIVDPVMAEEVLRDGKADLVAMGRGLLADPDLPNKTKDGRLDDIRLCLGCCQGCRNTRVGRALSCLSNPEVGRDRELRIVPTAEPKKVVVVGGGPGGLEAARVAALRGHTVTLFERQQVLGGRLRCGTVAPYKQEMGGILDYLAGQMPKLGVELRIGESATPETVAALRPGAVIMATGAQPVIPTLPGVDRMHVVLAEEVLLGHVAVGQKVVVMGGGSTGCEVAEHLAALGKAVTIVTRIGSVAQVARDVPSDRRALLMKRLQEAGVEILTATALQEIGENTVLVRHLDEVVNLPAESVVLAQGYRPSDELAGQLRSLGVPIHLIGDARDCRTAKEAIREGSEVARSL